MKYIITYLLLFTVTIFSQDYTTNKLIEEIKNRFNEVNDYSVDVEIFVNMDFLKMPNSKAKLYFKKPDKFKFNSTGFAILPKAGIDFNPQKILNYDHEIENMGKTTIENKELDMLKIIPLADTLGFKSAILLIDSDKILINQISVALENGATIASNFSYEETNQFPLPSRINVNFDFSEKAEDETKKNRRRSMPENFKGEIIIKYSDYKVNLGIDDSIFEEEEKEEGEKSEK